jgi:hypothetical protein
MKKNFLQISSQLDEDKIFILSNLLFWAAIFFVFFASGVSNLDPDFAWHIRVGQDIALEKQAPTIEKYLFTTLGENWVDHEWLSNLCLFLVYNLFGQFGYLALGFFFATTATFSLMLVLGMTKKYFVDTISRWNLFFLNSFSITLAIFSLFNSYGIRLQVLSWLFFVLCFLFYFKISREKKWLYLTAFPLLFFFWANLHGTFILGLAISLLLFAFLFWQYKSIPLRKKIFFSALGTIFATFLTPYDIELWKLIIIEYTQNNSYFGLIFEWLPLYAIPYIQWRATLYIALFLFLFLVSLFLKKIPKKSSFFLYLAFLFAFLLLSIQARRFFPMFVLASIPFVIFIMANLTKKEIIEKWFGFLIILIAIPIIIYQLFITTSTPLDPLTQNGSTSPYDATLFLKNNSEFSKHNIYNDYDWGGYLVLMWPEKLHFIDGRMPQKPLTNGTSFIEEYFKLKGSEVITKEKLTEHNIKLALLKRQKTLKEDFSGFEIFVLEKLFLFNFNKFDKPDFLRIYLEKNWEIIYTDSISVIYANPELR